MEHITLLEQKVVDLLVHTKRLKDSNGELLKEVHTLSSNLEKLTDECELIRTELDSAQKSNIQLLSEKELLTKRLEALENSLLQESGHIEELSQERELTRVVLDDLIRSIDSIVETEMQP